MAIPGDDTGVTTTCYARARRPPAVGYVRNFFGCYNVTITGAEECTPTGAILGVTYPMPNESVAAASAENGDPNSCNCEVLYEGEGCYVASSSYTAGLGPDSVIANFLQISGSCSRAEVQYI